MSDLTLLFLLLAIVWGLALREQYVGIKENRQ